METNVAIGFGVGLILGGLLGGVIAMLLGLRRKEAQLREEQLRMEAALEPMRKEFSALSLLLTEERETNAENVQAIHEQLKDRFERIDKLVLRVGADAQGLKAALQGNVNLRGQWGEMILEQILEQSGLLRGIHYEAQHTVEDGGGGRADMVVHLPRGGAIVIDSKALFPYFSRAIHAESAEERKKALEEHVKSFRTTVRNLSMRHYEKHVKGSIDFVLMFIPLEGAYQAAIGADPAVLSDAMAKNVMPVGPSSLILMLSLIQRIWCREEETRNTRKILDAAHTLSDRVISFQDELNAMGVALEKAQTAYEKAVHRMMSTDSRAPSIVNSQNVLKRLQGLMAETKREDTDE